MKRKRMIMICYGAVPAVSVIIITASFTTENKIYIRNNVEIANLYNYANYFDCEAMTV